MNVNHHKNKIYLNLFLGIGWTALKGSQWIFENNFKWTDYALLGIGFFYLAVAIVYWFSYYFEYNQADITVFGLLGLRSKTIKIKDLIEVHYFAGEYKFRTLDEKMVIVKSQIRKSQLADFDAYFQTIKNNFDNRLIVTL
jgi:hypothetical protein